MKCAGDCGTNLRGARGGWRKMCESCFQKGCSGHYLNFKSNGPDILPEVKGLAYPYTSEWGKKKVEDDPSILEDNV